ncbi:integrator complex subunit 12-like isoform X2 [Leptopilina heterotoma]|uniref:integrator complex subunit 12-like isoform X2 n=1 Tax=Leptopilina heterotoma TaxID=63436 RepID=UPI001CA810B2|nr:integrator complex subunit 12-like isoform X2 [Leptopilina heterotoma]
MDELTIERVYNKAFSLLHSSEENSGENLRLMLDSMIQEKFGLQKTVTQRLSQTFLNKAEMGEPQSVSLETIKIFKTDSEDYDDVPTISIPDEGSEESVSQMKNGTDESFILLECHNCLEISQPLDSELIDMGNFNTELIWLCENCNQNARETTNLKTYSNPERVCRKIKLPHNKCGNAK